MIKVDLQSIYKMLVDALDPNKVMILYKRLDECTITTLYHHKETELYNCTCYTKEANGMTVYIIKDVTGYKPYDIFYHNDLKELIMIIFRDNLFNMTVTELFEQFVAISRNLIYANSNIDKLDNDALFRSTLEKAPYAIATKIIQNFLNNITEEEYSEIAAKLSFEGDKEKAIDFFRFCSVAGIDDIFTFI